MADTAYRVVLLTPIRKLIAVRMAHAKQTIPHFRVHATFEVDRLIELRNALNARSDARVSLNDLLIKACAAALVQVPEVNVQWAESEIHQYAKADVSVVTALPGGVSTPVVRAADTKSVQTISVEVKALAARAAENKLRVDELTGGSFSISNLGMYGVEAFDAIINPPQCAMLAVGRAEPQLLVGEDRNSRVATCMRVTLSVDHRAIDGATAAVFLAALRAQVEQPQQMLSKVEQA